MGSHAIRSDEALRREKMNPSSVSDYPDLITDTTAVFGMVRLIPDIIDEVKESVTLTAKFPDFDLENAMELGAAELMNPPDIDLRGDTNGTYTLMLVDADAPTSRNPKYRSFLHWLVVNIPVVDVARGVEVVPYEVPEAQGGDRHRCALLVFKQTGPLTPEDLVPKNRTGFQVRDWCKSHNCTSAPAAAYFFYTKEKEV